MPEGRAKINTIIKYINDGRYSNAPIIVPVPIIENIYSVLNIFVPVTRTPEISHTKFSQIIARTQDHSVTVYGQGIFKATYSSYADAQTALGITRISRTVSRYINTGKLYKNRYEFKTPS